MKKILTSIACICFASFFLTSCIVSKKKFLAEQARANSEHANAVALQKDLADEKMTNEDVSIMEMSDIACSAIANDNSLDVYVKQQMK